MTIESEIAALTQATTDLLSAVNVRKTALDNSVTEATAQVTLATAQAQLSATSATSSSTSASNAASSAASASTSATSAQTSATAAGNSATLASNSASSASTSATTATTKAAEASASASAATAASAAINVTANVTAWSAATAYTEGTVVYSKLNYQNYRRKVTGTTATDPSQDSVNWEAVGFGPVDIGTAPNQVPLNQYLGGMAFQSHYGVNIEGGIFQGQVRRRAPVTKTAAFTVADTEHWLICNGTASITVTLPDPVINLGREIMILNRAAFTVVSASSNVVPLLGGAAGTAILAATAGKYVTLVSDGTSWLIMVAN